MVGWKEIGGWSPISFQPPLKMGYSIPYCRAKRGIKKYPLERKGSSEAAYSLGDQLIELLELEHIEYRRYQLDGVFVMELELPLTWEVAQLLARIVKT